MSEQTCSDQERKQKVFRTGKVSWNQGISINLSLKTQKKGSPGKNFEYFSPRYSSNCILNGRLEGCTQLRPFFPKIRALLFGFQKGQGRPPPSLPPPSCAPADYARIVNMPRYSYHKIITIVTVIMLEFLSARFEHPGSLLLFYLFLTRVRT